jgi:hypothetical protein
MENSTQPKKYKFAFLIWLFIYPVFTVLSKSLMPLMIDFPSLLQNFILSMILVPLMVWVYIPYTRGAFVEY